MDQQKQKNYDISIEWVNKKADKYFVKFDKINIPIEMTKSYYKNLRKYLEN